MNKQQYLRIKKLIDKIEDEALEDKVDITSPRFQAIIVKLLNNKGFTLEEYEEFENPEEDKPLKIEGVSQLKGDKGEKGDKGDIGDTVVGPQGLAGKDGKTIVGPTGKSGKPGKDGKDGKNATFLRGKPGEQGSPGVDGKSVDKEEVQGIIKEEVKSQVGSPLLEDRVLKMTVKQQERIIEPLRRMGMGLQQQIDANQNTIGNFVDDETPTGTVNGSNKVFTVASTPKSGSLKVFANGQRVKGGGEDYTLSGVTITFVTAPPTNSIILVDYRY